MRSDDYQPNLKLITVRNCLLAILMLLALR